MPEPRARMRLPKLPRRRPPWQRAGIYARRTIGPKLGQLLAGFTFAFAATAVTDTVSSDARTPVLIVLAATSAVAAVCGAVAHYREKRCRRG